MVEDRVEGGLEWVGAALDLGKQQGALERRQGRGCELVGIRIPQVPTAVHGAQAPTDPGLPSSEAGRHRCSGSRVSLGEFATQ